MEIEKIPSHHRCWHCRHMLKINKYSISNIIIVFLTSEAQCKPQKAKKEKKIENHHQYDVRTLATKIEETNQQHSGKPSNFHKLHNFLRLANASFAVCDLSGIFYFVTNPISLERQRTLKVKKILTPTSSSNTNGLLCFNATISQNDFVRVVLYKYDLSFKIIFCSLVALKNILKLKTKSIRTVMRGAVLGFKYLCYGGVTQGSMLSTPLLGNYPCVGCLG